MQMRRRGLHVNNASLYDGTLYGSDADDVAQFHCNIASGSYMYLCQVVYASLLSLAVSYKPMNIMCGTACRTSRIPCPTRRPFERCGSSAAESAWRRTLVFCAICAVVAMVHFGLFRVLLESGQRLHVLCLSLAKAARCDCVLFAISTASCGGFCHLDDGFGGWIWRMDLADGFAARRRLLQSMEYR